MQQRDTVLTAEVSEPPGDEARAVVELQDQRHAVLRKQTTQHPLDLLGPFACHGPQTQGLLAVEFDHDQRPPTEPKITVPPAEPKATTPNAQAVAAAAPAGATAAASTAAAPAGSSQAGAPAFDRKIVSQDMVRLAGKNMAKAGELLEAYGVKRQKDLTDEQAAEIHPKILAALGE